MRADEPIPEIYPMGMLDHWHPMLPSKDLREKPVGVRLAERDIALFRGKGGEVGALDDICPHRRMRLSLGKVVGDKLQCKYHGWTFDCAGNGESPGTPKMHACASAFEARERYGYIWVKSKESNPVFPEFNMDHWVNICAIEHRAKAPFELALDNFCEIEHTPTTHDMFGYQLDRMSEVTVRYEMTDDTVTVRNAGPGKKLGWFLNFFLGVKDDYLFHDVWTTHFSPVYTVFDHHWAHPTSGEESWVRWRLFIFFTPVDEKESRITCFTYAKSKWPFGFYGGLRPFRGKMRRTMSREIKLDTEILAGLAVCDTRLEGMKLSRFDKALMLNRERIDRIYR